MRARGLVNRNRGALPPCPDASGVAEFHRSLPGYAATPLREAPELAAAAGVGRVLVKDEADRMGLPAFKILGASWATYRALLEHLDLPVGTPLDDLVGADVTLATATDGNHGRAVAFMAKRLGIPAKIFVPAGTTDARIDAILGEGASCTVVEGSYEDAVATAAATGDLVVSDTSWPGYETVPAWVIEGYATIFEEIEALSNVPVPDVVLVPLGVGALGAAVTQWYRCRGYTTRLVGVEPDDADCVLASVAAGEMIEVPGPHRSIMAGLNCGRPSPVAWPWVSNGFDGFLAIDDDAARAGMRALAAEGIVSGETGAAGAGALLTVTAGKGDDEAVEALGVGPDTIVLLLSTEGATDPEAWEAVVHG
ncbi:MAG: threonine dehydratase [Acidimicrobiales bacterium]|jgi:diaminopropionate ammonia-lyase|nr:threonine dehydratase [Acidimicrobiales bacterium]